MRMWLVNPGLMCPKHLLGEHVELHMIVGCINKKIKLDGYCEKKLIQLSSVKTRHAALAIEMRKRGYSHNSVLPDFSFDGYEHILGYRRVDKIQNHDELLRRCAGCRKINGMAGTADKTGLFK